MAGGDGIPETSVQITPEESLQVLYQRWLGRTKILHEGRELCRFGISGGMQSFMLAGADVEVESHHSLMGQVHITVRVGGKIVAQTRWM